MDTIQYIADTKGNNTGLLIDLLNPKTKKVLNNLNNIQIDFLKLFAGGIAEEHLQELKQIVTKYLAEKILDNGDKIWEEKKYSTKTFNTFVEND